MTKFRLVVGGNSPAVLQVFRDAERKVIGAEGASVREQATRRAKEEKTGLRALLAAPPATDSHYESLHARALEQAPRDVLARLAAVKSIPFRELRPGLLEAHHVTRTEIGQIIWKMYKQAEIRIENVKPRERAMNDDHILATVTAVYRDEYVSTNRADTEEEPHST